MTWIGKTLALARKDAVVEARGRDTLPPMVAFTGAVLVLLAFALPGTPRLVAPTRVPAGTIVTADVLSGFLWVTILFAGLIGFARTFEAERAEGALEALLLAPLDRSGLFVSKASANLLFLAALEIVLVPAFALLFGIDLGSRWAPFAGIVVLVDLGFVAVGTLFAALAAGSRSRELMLPILALPALVPVFIAAVELSSDLFVGAALSTVAARGWFAILLAYDVIFAIVGALAFEYALE